MSSYNYVRSGSRLIISYARSYDEKKHAELKIIIIISRLFVRLRAHVHFYIYIYCIKLCAHMTDIHIVIGIELLCNVCVRSRLGIIIFSFPHSRFVYVVLILCRFCGSLTVPPHFFVTFQILHEYGTYYV